jgi:hypothetical protein
MLRYAIVLNNVEAIKEALIKKGAIFADRAPFYMEINHLNVNLKGLYESFV